MTQGQIGYLLETAIARSTRPCRPRRCSPACWSTPTTRRSRGRPSRSGRSTTASGRGALALERGWDDAPTTPAAAGAASCRARGRARCSAPSHVRALLERGAVVIAGGGGGHPRRRATSPAWPAWSTRTAARPSWRSRSAPTLLVLLTGVPRVALDFGTRWERELAAITVADALRALADGEFPAGQHGPEDRVGRPLRRGRRRPRGDHRPRPAAAASRAKMARGWCATRRDRAPHGCAGGRPRLPA